MAAGRATEPQDDLTAWDEPRATRPRQGRPVDPGLDPESEIGGALRRLSEVVGRVDESAESLVGSIRAVLADREHVDPHATELAQAQNTALGQNLDDVTDRLARIARRLEDAYQRVEL